MPAPSLYDLAKSRLIANISLLTDISELPYTFMAPILRHIQNPAQLAALEKTCPQLVGETGEIWQKFIKRDIPDWETKPHEPRDPKNWPKVYKKLKREAEEEKRMQEERLREQMRALQGERGKNQTQIVEGRLGTVYGSYGRPKPRGTTSNWGERSGAPRPTGRVALDKLKRGMFDQKIARPKASRLPAHLLEQRKGQVARAPERLVRISEAEARAHVKKPVVVSKGAAAAVAGNKTGVPDRELRAPPKSSYASPDAPPTETTSVKAPPERPHLPPGIHFSAPKIRRQPVAAPGAAAGAAPAAQKRKREEPSLFHQPKRKRV
jgi:elongin-A